MSSTFSSGTTDSSSVPKIPFPTNVTDFPLWASQIKAALSALGLLDCITTARPPAVAAFTEAIPVYTAGADLSATQIATLRQNYLTEVQMYQASLSTHNVRAANVKRWDRAHSLILTNLGRAQLVFN